MKLILTVLILLFPLLADNAMSQGPGDQTLITVNGHKISAAEFEWAYKKNNSGTGKSTIDQYLDLYIDFQLKVEAAKESGIDKTVSFKRELAGYRKQLARNYLTDQNAKEQLLLNSYERYKEEINAYHILIKCPPDAAPADTVEAWQKAKKVRERIRLGEPFESVARGASDDPYVTLNGGNLGYFTVFQTPISFENAVYSMKPGALSGPIRTSSGYHIIKVQDRRKSSGRIRVAHIMKALPQGAGQIESAMVKRKIDSLYQLAIDRGDFATLAAENSDDIVSAGNGGEVPFFGSGEMIMEFSEKAFSLLHDGDISEPVRTIYGWHIIKRLEKQPFPEFDEAKSTLETKLNQSYLLSLSRKSFTEKLKREYNFKINKSILDWFYSIADSTFRSGDYKLEDLEVPDGDLFSFANINCNAADFISYIKEQGSQSTTADSIRFINTLLELKTYEELLTYEESILEIKYPEFRYLIDEFHDGILLFEISDSLIWKNGTISSEGMRDYYEGRKEDFISPPVASGIIYTIDNSLGKKRVGKLIKTIKKYSKDDDGIKLINSKATEEAKSYMTISEGKWVKGEDQLLDSFKWSKGYHQVSDSKYSYIVDMKTFSESEYQSFEDVRDSIVEDYLKYLEIEWLKQLRLKYPVIVDYNVLSSLKTRLSL